MGNESEAILLRVYIGESEKYEGKPLYRYLLEFFKEEGLSGATVIRGASGFGKKNIARTTSILRLSADLPVIIEVVDEKEKIDKIKPRLDEIIKEGLVTEEKVKIVFYRGGKTD